ncbi:GH92 family glycosyl hydrolase [Homoserinibacter sp. YIM 151385]|uniref:GH92 family glycosyl hydrolase n=1 Tax=Homoserinibacter sp. YIM 151385 TaxID=2985506 RepID=UPI0022F0EA32|nr:GH92 family glycosyl hydrolase [Homoserinibacter sp. YIM 151385]WBU37260.1 GH92 family glycosyl hydrolase [Homoserinibacter sp. YIM 151385]
MAGSPAVAAELSPFEAVDLFIGTELDTTQNKSNDAYGNTYPGASVPFGMVQPSPTTYKLGETADLVREKGGYEYTANQIRGFGMTRYSGTGCHTRFGGYEFPTIPFTGELGAEGVLPRNPATDHRSYFLGFSHDDEVAEPGYYAVTTADGTTSELTATARTAVSRFDFSGAEGSTLILDASGANNRTFEVSLDIDAETRTVSGSMYGTDVCDNGNHYRAYFSTTYDQDFASFGTWEDAAMTAGSTSAAVAGATSSDQRHKTGGWVTFADDAVVTATTGFSYVSTGSAAANAAAEVGDAGFDEVRADARGAWESALGTLDAQGGTEEERTKLYTALYHSLLQPTIGQDVDGRYLGFDGRIHEVAEGRDLFRRINFAGQGWDMYRSQAQLIAMLFPEVANDINRSIVLLTQQTGRWSPGAARMSGDNYQVILSTLDAFGATDYDRQAALDSMLRTQQLPATESTRSNAAQYFATGMIENAKGDFATSRVLEYAVDDFAIAQLAKRLGDEDAYDRMMVRAQNWMNVFDPQTQHIRPRARAGFDRSFDLRGRDGTGGGQFNQSTGYQYGWMVPHNIGTLIEKRGGIEKSARELDVLMAQLDAGAYTQTGNYLSNEAALTTPWVYNWLRAPHTSTDVLHRAVTELYDTTPSGLPGNDDEGALSSWYVFANLGIAPVIHGTADLVVTAPLFERITIRSADSDRVYDIVAPGAAAGGATRYTTALEVDGVAQTASWLDEDFARDGGTLEFTLSDRPGTWGTGAGDVPRSHTDGADARNNVGTTPNGRGNLGSMDLSDWSLSREGLAAAGAGPGQKIRHGSTGIEFTWPQTDPGRPDNWIPHGQRIELGGRTAGSLAFLGLATNGPAWGTAVVEYTDGTTQDVRVELADWSANPVAGGSTLVTVGSRNNMANGSANGTFRVFGTRPALLDVTKRVEAVILPQQTDRGIMHIFDVATSEQEYVDLDAPTGTPERVILNPTADPSTSQHVTWRSRSPLTLQGTVEIRTPGGEVRTVRAVQKPERSIGGYPARSHSARITGLEPDTEYQYRVASGSQRSVWRTFTTAAAEAEPFTFLYFGDAQEGIGSVWHDSVDAAVAASPEAELALYAGDMVNTSTNDSEWRDWFAGIEDLGARTNSLTTPGNHEVGPEPFMESYLDSFEYDANGPVAADALEYEREWGAHLEKILEDTVYVTDYQGVRFVSLNANRDDICPMLLSGGATSGCEVGKRAWMTAQATWLDRVLRQNPNEWTVVLAHQPVFSTGISGNGLRDESDWRQYVLPVLEKHDVDLVLQGHDHTYGRGHHSSTATGMPGVTAGPVYVVSNAGQKQYTLPSADDNIWTRNGAVAVQRAQDTSTFQSIRVDGDTLSYESVVTYTRPGGAASTQAGDTLDRFTITKRADGAKWVTEAGVEVPDASTPPVNHERPFSGTFDPETFGEVVWEDDFTTDRLDEYEIFGDTAEASAALSVDTDAGVLEAQADGRRWSHVALPAEAGERFALIVTPESMAGTGASEDSLFLGLTDGPTNRAHSWYNHSRRSSGLDIVERGAGRSLSSGRGSLAVAWEPGDRLATVLDQGELSSWIEQDGEWQPIRSGLLPLTIERSVFEGWAPTLSLRLDAGTIGIDRLTLIQPGDGTVEPPEPTLVTPAAVTFADLPGTASDTFTVPVSEGVEYLVADDVVEPGTHPGRGEVTVRARALEGFAIREGATADWSLRFTDVEEPVEPVEPVAPDASQLTDANRGDVAAPDLAHRGQTITVVVGEQHAGAEVHAWLFSTPTPLGAATVDADGEIRVTVPARAALGDHRLAVALADGELLGWDGMRVAAAADDGGSDSDGSGTDGSGTDGAGVDGLAATGTEAGWVAGAAVLLLLLGGGIAILVRRRRGAGPAA